MYKIQEAEMLANNIYRMVVEAPRVAQQLPPWTVCYCSRQVKKEKEFL